MKHRSFWWLPLSALLMLWTFSSTLTGCPQSSGTEEIAQDSGPVETKPEPQPEPQVEQAGKPPKGVGADCVQGPRGNNCDTSESPMLCLAVNSTKSVCYENCTATGKCMDPNEKCITATSDGLRGCYILASKGETCGVAIRTRCDEDLVDPPVFCIEGKCTERPQEGWDLGQACLPPRGNEQSDCKTGLICTELAKNDYRCFKKCEADTDCPNGEVCWDEPLNKKVCLIGSKEGGPCDRNKRQFCKSDDPANYPLSCRNDKCESTVSYVKLGEKCRKDIDPSKKQGDCEPGLYCLGVSEFEARCHKPCQASTECPSGEVCVTHPNYPNDPEKACVIPVKLGETCNLLDRKYCHSGTDQILRCKLPENQNAGTCIEVKVGDACVNASECGPMICVPFSATNLYCLFPCNPNNPTCPGNGTCAAFGDMGMPPFACIPNGPKKLDQPCKALKAEGANIDTSELCEGSLLCAVPQGAAGGVCYETVPGCTATACQGAVQRVCIPIQNGGLCAKDCSAGSGQTCDGGTTCTDFQQAKICL
ncbi:MAG: hypothetical protein H6728_13720 [Myxococcales bacterium]|nr:hypothetical protein [Myxococcales bacterium]